MITLSEYDAMVTGLWRVKGVKHGKLIPKPLEVLEEEPPPVSLATLMEHGDEARLLSD